jgi:hypothetical protein
MQAICSERKKRKGRERDDGIAMSALAYPVLVALAGLDQSM